MGLVVKNVMKRIMLFIFCESFFARLLKLTIWPDVLNVITNCSSTSKGQVKSEYPLARSVTFSGDVVVAENAGVALFC